LARRRLGIELVIHAYKKQGQKAPKKELDVARKRLKELLS
jgi:phage-related protein